jgi:NAD(P)-dependent dehydrogenase (short-subunit alcohol dehydrogenase family)
MNELKGRVALITGGGRGLGRATAVACAREGADVVAADILGDGVAETAREAQTLGVKAIGVTCDTSDEPQVEALIKQTVTEFGRLDILVNTVAWIEPPALIREMLLENWEKTLKYDLTTHFLACKHAVNVMIDQNYGRIVNVSSEAGKGGYRLRGSYCAAKAGVITLSQTLAVETSDYDIRVNAICPRGIAGARLDTIRDMMSEYRQQHENMPSTLPPQPPRERQPGAWGGTMNPPEVAELILWLVSPAGSRVNGQAISIG